MKALMKQPAVLAGIFFIILVGVLFSPVIIGGKTFGSSDSLAPQAVGMALNKTQEESGEYPLWQPWIFSGMPTAEAFTHISKLYFPEYLFKIFFLPGILIQLIHLIFAGLGGFILLRYLHCSKSASFLGGTGFMLTPYMITMIVFGHGSQLMTAAYIPWIFWLTLKLWHKPEILTTGWLAILLGFQLQRAHAQIAYYTWMFIGAFALLSLVLLVRNKEMRHEAYKSLSLFSGALILGVGLAVIIYYPSLEYTPFSVRGGSAGGGADYGYATGWSFHPKEMMTFLIPSAFGFGGQTYWGFMPFTDYPNYMGIVILMLAFIGLIYRRDTLSLFLLGTSILALFISFGKHFSLVYDLFFNLFPFFNKFRVPAMILILVQFNVSILAAFGLDSILRNHKASIPKWIYGLIGIVVVALIILSLGGSGIESWIRSKFSTPRIQDPRIIKSINELRWELWIKDAWLMLIFSGGLVGIIWLKIQKKLSGQIVSVVIICMAIVDIGWIDQKIIEPERRSGRTAQLISKRAIERFFEPDEIISYLKSDTTQFRIYPAGYIFGESRFASFRLESVGGYHPAKLKVYNDFLKSSRNAGTLPILQMLNVKYLITTEAINHPDLIPVKSGRMKSGRGDTHAQVLKLRQTLPRAWFVSDVKQLKSAELVWTAITQPEFNPLNIAYITDEINQYNFNGNGETNVISEVNKTTIKTHTTEAGFLVVSEVYYPLRWKAYVDGEPVKTYETNGILRGVIVPKGSHKVEFIYDRSSFNRGIMVSLLSFAVAVGFVVSGYFLKRRKV